jgi:hypothetical protein
VAFQYRGGDILIIRTGKAINLNHRRVALEPELRTKSRADIAVMLKIAPFMPNRPEMHVTGPVIMPGITKAKRSG